MDKTLHVLIMNFGQMLNFTPAHGSRASDRIRRTRETISARSDMDAMSRDAMAVGQDMARIISRESRG